MPTKASVRKVIYLVPKKKATGVNLKHFKKEYKQISKRCTFVDQRRTGEIYGFITYNALIEGALPNSNLTDQETGNGCTCLVVNSGILHSCQLCFNVISRLRPVNQTGDAFGNAICYGIRHINMTGFVGGLMYVHERQKRKVEYYHELYTQFSLISGHGCGLAYKQTAPIKKFEDSLSQSFLTFFESQIL